MQFFREKSSFISFMFITSHEWLVQRILDSVGPSTLDDTWPYVTNFRLLLCVPDFGSDMVSAWDQHGMNMGRTCNQHGLKIRTLVQLLHTRNEKIHQVGTKRSRARIQCITYLPFSCVTSKMGGPENFFDDQEITLDIPNVSQLKSFLTQNTPEAKSEQ